MSEWSNKSKERLNQAFSELSNLGNNQQVAPNDDDNIFQAAYHGAMGSGGSLIHTANDALTLMGKPNYISDDDWLKNQSSISKAISDFGVSLEKDHIRNYKEGTANRYASGIGSIIPSALGLGLGTAAAVRTANPKLAGQVAENVLYRGGTALTSELMQSGLPGAGRVVSSVAKYTPKIAEIAGDVTPSAVVGIASAIPEAGIEKQYAYDDYIKDAKNNGTYVKGQTEQEAADVGNKVFNMNMELLAGGNAVEMVATFSKLKGLLPKKTFMRGLTRLGVTMGSEGFQEGAQEIIPKIAKNEEWSINDSDVKESAIIGALGGGLFHGAGKTAQYLLNRKNSNVNSNTNQTENVATENTNQADLSSKEQNIQVPQLQVDGGVEDYNGVEENTKVAANIFGQKLKDDFGIEPTITSGRRSEANNAAVGGSPTSWHLSGKAIDLDVGEITEEQANQIKQMALDSGWGEVLYHDAGTGKHLHLANYNGDVSGYNSDKQSNNIKPPVIEQLSQDDLNAMADKLNEGLNQNSLNPEQRQQVQAIFEMANQKANESQDINVINAMENAIDNKNIKGIAELFPSEMAQILMPEKQVGLNDGNVTQDDITIKKSGNSYLEQAHDAAEKGDYISASKLAYKAGDANWYATYKSMNERLNKENQNILINGNKIKPSLAKVQLAQEIADSKNGVGNLLEDEINSIKNIKTKNENTSDVSGYQWLNMEKKKQGTQNLVNILNSINAQKFDKASEEAFKKQLNDEENLFFDYLKYQGGNQIETVNNLKSALVKENEEAILNHIEGLKKQMAQGVTPRSVSYNKTTGEYIPLPGYSNNYQWYRDMIALNNGRRMNKADTEAYLREVAVNHLRNGYVDPVYGDQVSAEQINNFNDVEDAIRGIESIEEKASRYSDVIGANQRSGSESKGNISQEDIELTKELGKLLVEKSKAVGIKANYKNIENHAQRGIKKPVDYLEKKLQEKGVNVNEIKEQAKENIKILENKEVKDDYSRKAVQTEVNNTKENINESQNNKNEKVFGDLEDAENNLLKSLGLERNKQLEKNKKKTLNIVDDSDEAISKYIAELKSELNNISANPVFNPKLMNLSFKLGVAYLQKGFNNFAEWSSKMVGSVGDKIEPWLQSTWDSINALPENVVFDSDKMQTAFKYVGVKFEYGNNDLDLIIKHFEDLVGKEKSEKFIPLIKAAYAGVNTYFNKNENVVKYNKNNIEGAVENEHNDSANSVAKRDSQREDKNSMGTNDGNSEPVGRRGQSDSKIEGKEHSIRSNMELHDDSSVISGEVSDSTIREEKSSDNERSTRGAELSRGVVDSYEGMEIDRGRTKPIDESFKNGRNNERNNVEENKAGVLEEIKNDLPCLLVEQADDVVKAEKRFYQDSEQGILFTNGTGTGKTFTGLGVLARMYKQGKKNILIVSPKQEINKQWIDSAKKYFNIDINELKNTEDSGNDVTITTYANLQDNSSLVKRDWDLVIADESHNLMNNEQGDSTKALKMFRALTFHARGLHNRFEALFKNDKITNLEKQLRKIKDKKSSEYKEIKDKIIEEERKISEEKNKTKILKEWKELPKIMKPKTVFLSATPFAYDKNIDYAEGYLFDYSKVDRTGYNSADGREKFFIENFGYRMRYNKLTKPETTVDNRVMEVAFHERLKKSGALSGRMLNIDKDYDRGFILVDSGIGQQIDEGFSILRDPKNNFRELHDYLSKQFNGHIRNYMLESIKARESIPLIKEYIKNGKKVVLFHDCKKVRETAHPFKLKDIFVSIYSEDNQIQEIKNQYSRFKQLYPKYVSLNLSSLQSPIETIQGAFKDDVLFLNGDVPRKQCNANVSLFNSDTSGKNLIMVQSDKGNAGISLHDVTGKHQRVLINLGIPKRPTYAIQIEGRIYRTGSATNAIIRYLSTGTDVEKNLFANTIAQRASTAENLALGQDARNLRDGFIDAFTATLDGTWVENLPGAENEGIGGKEKDRSINDAYSDFDRAKTLYYANQKKNSKNKASEGNDYFATPEPLGYKMVDWADIKEGESVLEPSAGHGAIARFFSPNVKSVAIEPSGKLSPLLQLNTEGTSVINGTFEDYYVGNKFNAIVMNPPFGRGGKIAVEHLAKAFKQLKDGGRIVAILPNGPSCQKHFDKWFYGEDKEVNSGVLVKEIILPSVTFNRAGTNVICKVVVIDKYNDEKIRSESVAFSEGAVEFNNIDNIEDFFNRIENFSIPKRRNIDNENNVTDEISNKKDVNTDEFSNKKDDENKKVTSSMYTHTKTKEEIPLAKLVDHVEDWRSISSLAKKHGGYYSSYAKGFLFKENSKRDDFVKECSAFLNDVDTKLSIEGSSPKGLLDNIEFIKQDEFTSYENSIAQLGDDMGVPVVFFKGPIELNGFHSQGISFINRNGHKTIGNVFWHEFFHWMRNNNEKLYNELLSHFKGEGKITKSQIDEYKENIGRTELSDDEAIEEILADNMSIVSRRVGLIKSLAKENQTLLEKFVAWVRNIIDKINDFVMVNATAVDFNKAQLKAFQDGFLKLVGDLVNNDGKRIFIVRGNGDIVLAGNGYKVEDLYELEPQVTFSVKNSIESLNHSENQGGFSMPEDKTKYSINDNFKFANNKFLKSLGLKSEENVNVMKKESDKNDVNVARRFLNSFRKTTEKYPKLKPFFRAARKAHEVQENLRTHFQHRMDKVDKVLGSTSNVFSNAHEKFKENKSMLREILWQGDAERKEFTVAELKEMGANDNVIRGYKMVRAAISKAYKLVNDIKQQIKTYSKTINEKELKELEQNKFVKIISSVKDDTGNYFVTWEQPKIYERKEILSKSELEALKEDDNVQILSSKLEKSSIHILPESSRVIRGDDFYEVEYRSQASPLAKIEGYIPHFFHNLFIMQKVDNGDGTYSYNMLKSAKTMTEAIKLGNKYVNENPNTEIVISQKQFQFPDEALQASVVGDKDYFKTTQRLAEDLSISLNDAQKLMNDKIKLKNRRRYFGNAVHRKGVDGFEKDMDYVLRHYFNMVSRYVAMDEFKRVSINRFEQVFGKFDDEHNNNKQAQLIKNYINDINGVPTAVEDVLNSLLKQTPIIKSFVGKTFGDRPALEMAGWLTKVAAIAKLNVLNVASTLIQFTQLMNVAGCLNDYGYLVEGMKAAINPTVAEKVILHKAGLEAELSMNVTGGYSKAEIANKFLGKTTWTFNKADRFLRATAILGAYRQGIDKGLGKAKAMQYAKDVNHKANFDYSVANAPDIFRRGGPLSQVILQFQKFPIMQLELMWDVFAQGQNLDTKSMKSFGKSLIEIIKNNDKKQCARFFAPYFLLSGFIGIPFVSVFGGILGALFGHGDDWDEELKKAAFEWAGNNSTKKAFVRFCIYGGLAIPENGADISYRVGIGDFGRLEMPKTGGEAIAKLFGVAGSSIYQASKQLSSGNINEAIKAISPGVGNIAIAMSGKVKTTRGRDKYSFGEDAYGRVLKGLGFMPIKEKIDSDITRIVKSEEIKKREDEVKAIDEYLREPSRENINKLKEMKISAKRVDMERKKKNQTPAERLTKKQKYEYSKLDDVM